MARAASQGTVSSDMKPTDYRGATQRLKSIDAKKSKQQEIAKSIGDIYNACEAICGVNKTAAKIFMMFRKLEEAEQITVFRDLNGLMDAAGMSAVGADLVDQAQGKDVKLRLAVNNGHGGDDDGESIDEELDELEEEIDQENAEKEDVSAGDDFEEASEEELAAQKPRAEAAAKKRAATAVSDPEPYTGDNSDLADSGDE